MTLALTPAPRRGHLLLALALLVLAACGQDKIVTPTFGDGCSAGALSPGQTVTRSLSPTSCIDPHNFWANTAIPYEGWSVHLIKGKAYMFYEQAVPDSAHGNANNVDALLVMYGKNSDGVSVPLALSDDEADASNSVIFFVAPQSGDYRLVAGSFAFGEFGGYRLSMQECPVLATLDTAGTYALHLQPSPCIRPTAGGTPSSSAYSFIAIPGNPIGAADSLGITVTSAAFAPVWEEFGAGFDTYANLYAGSDYNAQSNSGILTTIRTLGPSTLAVGSQTADSAGAFTVQFGRAVLVAPPAPVDGNGGPLLRSAFPPKIR